MKATIWTQEGCPLCAKVKEYYGEGNYEERPVSDLMSGKDRDMDAMAQLMMQNMELPLVMVESEFVSPRDILAGKTAEAA